jgi:hypothetical protein
MQLHISPNRLLFRLAFRKKLNDSDESATCRDRRYERIAVPIKEIRIGLPSGINPLIRRSQRNTDDSTALQLPQPTHHLTAKPAKGWVSGM